MSRRILVVLSLGTLMAVAGIASAQEYEKLFDTWWLPLVHDWTQQLHEPEGAEFRKIEVPEGEDIFWEIGGDRPPRWTEILLSPSSETATTSVGIDYRSHFELQDDGEKLLIRDADTHGFPIAIYRRVEETAVMDTIVGEWDFSGGRLTIVEVPYAPSLDLFILHEDVPIVDIAQGAYIVEEISDGVIKAETFGVLDSFYILFDPTDDERMWLTTEEEGPDIEPWIDYSGLDVAYLNKLDQRPIESR
ncbi:MAG: hypothetical protein ACLFM0_00640 [Spirochaetales bacterium]